MRLVPSHSGLDEFVFRGNIPVVEPPGDIASSFDVHDRIVGMATSKLIGMLSRVATEADPGAVGSIERQCDVATQF
ncbi:hypothetical protein [Haloarcula halophila]|uniref:hypothetical protein n=1 Tax=Haloarcula TaxID=2237 RepID=UPI0023E429CC|nr:hypothetical protein [Halomicroarcula sp. DFY41]